MGIEKLNKKNPPTPASSPSATSTQVEVLVYIYKYFYVFTVEVALGELARVAERREEQSSKCWCKLLSWSSLESSRAYLTN